MALLKNTSPSISWPCGMCTFAFSQQQHNIDIS
jgi:hypothetical protein